MSTTWTYLLSSFFADGLFSLAEEVLVLKELFSSKQGTRVTMLIFFVLLGMWDAVWESGFNSLQTQSQKHQSLIPLGVLEVATSAVCYCSRRRLLK